MERTVEETRNAPTTFRFDSFVVDPANRIVLRDGREVPLTGKIFDVLVAFLERPGRLIPKEELIRAVWHYEFVEEQNLARSVSTLRKALGDTGKQHKYIATVQGRGYRFIARVESIGEHDEGLIDSPISSSKPAVRAVRFRSPAILLAVIVAVVLGTAAFLALESGRSSVRSRPPFAFENVRIAKLTQDGIVYAGSISPDGQYLAYVTSSGPDPALCVRQLATGSILKLLPADAGRKYWGWRISPDNRSLYYILKNDTSDKAGLYRIPLVGGESVKIADHADGGPSISPDGAQVAFSRIDRETGKVSLLVADVGGGKERVIDTLELPSMYHTFEWSPDGTGFLVVIKQREDEKDFWYIAEMPATGGEKRQISDRSDHKMIAALRSPGSDGILLNAVDEFSGQPQVYYISGPDGERRRITNDLNYYFGMSLTSDGRTIVTNQTYVNRQIWVVPLATPTRSLQVTSGSENHFDSIDWIDGENLIYDDDEGSSFNSFNIWRMKVNGSDRRPLTSGSGAGSQPGMSSGGQKVVFVSRRTGKRELWSMLPDGKDQRQLLHLEPDVSEPRSTADGQTVYFLADVGGTAQIWSVPGVGGVPRVVIDADIHKWALSPDGSRIVYTSFETSESRMVTRIQRLDGTEPSKVIDIPSTIDIRWAPDGNSLYYTSDADIGRNIWRMDLGGGAPRPVTAFTDQSIFDFALSADGRTIACIRQMITYDAVMIRSE